jgi:hypothetical protein
MTLTYQTLVLGLDDAQISPLTADTSDALTYGTAIDVPGMQNISLSSNYTTKELYTDELVGDYYSQFDSINWSISNAQVCLDVLAILEGGTITSSGTSPNEVNTYTLSNTSAPSYFKIEGQIIYSSGTVGDFHTVLYKCKVGSIQVNYQCQNYAIVSASGLAIATVYNGVVRDDIINQTATPI